MKYERSDDMWSFYVRKFYKKRVKVQTDQGKLNSLFRNSDEDLYRSGCASARCRLSVTHETAFSFLGHQSKVPRTYLPMMIEIVMRLSLLVLQFV